MLNHVLFVSIYFIMKKKIFTSILL